MSEAPPTVPGQPATAETHRRWVYLGVVLAAVFWAYAPSIHHLPRSDQIDYLADISTTRTFGDLLGETLSYNRTRVIEPGDSMLFRPAFFLLLALETWCFGASFELWQLFGILLHLCCVAALYLLLQDARERLAPGAKFAGKAIEDWVPAVFALFFGMSFSNQEMVIWTHIHGYLVFILLTLLTAREYLRANPSAGSDDVGDRVWWRCWAMTLVATFFYELGQLTALLLAASERSRDPAGRRWKTALLIPVLYQAVNFVDRGLHQFAPVSGETFANVVAAGVSTDSLWNFARFFWMTLGQPFFASLVQMRFGDRLMVREEPLMDLFANPQAWVWGALLLAFGIVTFYGLRAQAKSASPRRRWGLLGLLPGVMLGYAAMNVLGRMNLRPEPNQLELNPYYAYLPFLVLSTLGGLGALATPGALGPPVWPQLRVIVMVGLVALSGVSGWRVREVNEKLAQAFDGPRVAVTKLSRLVRGKVAFDPESELAQAQKYGIPYTTFFFHWNEDASQPETVLRWEGGTAKSEKASEYRARKGIKPEEDLFPSLVAIRTRHNIWRFRGETWMIPHFVGTPTAAMIAELPRESCTLARLEQENERLPGCAQAMSKLAQAKAERAAAAKKQAPGPGAPKSGQASGSAGRQGPRGR